MKRYGEKATREALAQGATIREIHDPMRGPIWRVRQDDETMGYITMDLFTKLHQDGTIERTAYGYMHEDYSMSTQAWNALSDRVHADASASLAKAGLLAEPQEQPQEAPQPEPKYYRNCETQETTNSATEAMGWHRVGINVTVCQRLAADHVRIVRISGAPQEQPKSEDQENRAYARGIAQEVENYHRGHLRRCPCCEGIVERDDWDDLDVFTCPHCDDLDDVGQWEALTLHDYLEDVLDITYIVQSDRQTLDGAKFYVTLGGPSVWLDTCSRAVELRWGGRSASWGLSFSLCDELDEIAQEYWDLG